MVDGSLNSILVNLEGFMLGTIIGDRLRRLLNITYLSEVKFYRVPYKDFL